MEETSGWPRLAWSFQLPGLLTLHAFLQRARSKLAGRHPRPSPQDSSLYYLSSLLVLSPTFELPNPWDLMLGNIFRCQLLEVLTQNARVMFFVALSHLFMKCSGHFSYVLWYKIYGGCSATLEDSKRPCESPGSAVAFLWSLGSTYLMFRNGMWDLD